MKKIIFKIKYCMIISCLIAFNYPQVKSALNENIQIDGLELSNVLKEYGELIEKYPDNKNLFYNLGNLNYLNGDLDSAVKNYNKALIDGESEENIQTLYNLGNVYNEKGELEKSIEYYKKALQISSEDKEIRYNYELSKKMLNRSKQNFEENDSKEGEDGKENNDSEGSSADKGGSDKNNNEESDSASDSNNLENDGDRNSKEEEGSSQVEESSDQEKELSADKNDMSKSEGIDSLNAQDGKNDELESIDPNLDNRNNLTDEERLGRQEAEAILNAIKANEDNMKDKKYKVGKFYGLEKDW